MSLTAASSSANPASSFSALWAHLKPAIDHIMSASSFEGENRSSFDYATYTSIHTSLFNYFAKQCREARLSEGKIPGQEVYDKMDEFFQDVCKGILLAAPADGPILVAYVVSEFQKYSRRALAVHRLTSYINRHFVKRAADEEKGWINVEEALIITRQNCPNWNGLGDQTIAQIKVDYKLLALRRWGYTGDGDTTEAEACAEAASSLERIVPILSLAHRRFRVEVFEPLLSYPKSNNVARSRVRLKPPVSPPLYRPKGRLARAVQTFNDSTPTADSRSALSDLDLALSKTGVRPEAHLRKRLHQLLSLPEK